MPVDHELALDSFTHREGSISSCLGVWPFQHLSVVRQSQSLLITVPCSLPGANRHPLPRLIVGLYAYSQMQSQCNTNLEKTILLNMSWHPSNRNILSSQEKMAEQYVNFIVDSDVPIALTLEEIQSATAQDPTLQTVIKTINTGRWWKKLLFLVQAWMLWSVSGMSKIRFASRQN